MENLENNFMEKDSEWQQNMHIAKINIMAQEANKLSEQLLEKLRLWVPKLEKFLNCQETLEMEELRLLKEKKWEMLDFISEKNSAVSFERTKQLLEQKEMLLNLWVLDIEKIIWGIDYLISEEFPLVECWNETVSLYKGIARGADSQNVNFYYGYDEAPFEPVFTMKTKGFMKYVRLLFLTGYKLLQSPSIQKRFTDIKQEDLYLLEKYYQDIKKAIDGGACNRLLCYVEIRGPYATEQIRLFRPFSELKIS